MSNNGIKIPFGMADITIGEDENKIKFDGAENFQAEGGEISIEPILAEIQIADFGESIYDELLNGFTGELTIVGAEDKLEVIEQVFGYLEPIEVGGEVKKLTDARMGASMREKGKRVVIHPRIMGEDTSLDIVIFKMAGVAEFNRSFANEQGNVPITLKMYPKDGLDANDVGNFFEIGGEEEEQYTVTFKETMEEESVSVTVYNDEERTEQIGDVVYTDTNGEATKDLIDGVYYYTAVKGEQYALGDFEVVGVDKTVEFTIE